MQLTNGFRPRDIRNIALVGHGGSGKTLLSEAILHRCGAISRFGSVDNGTTTSDFEPESRLHRHSTSSNLLFAVHEGCQLNLIDTPGMPDLIGHALAALPAVETAIIVVNAANGIEFNTRRLFQAASELFLAKMVVINKIDLGLAKLPALLEELREAFGPGVHCINLPARGGQDVIDCFDQDTGEAEFGSPAQLHREILESAIESDDGELERYLSGEILDLPRLRACFVKAMNQGHMTPVLLASAKDEVGIDDLVHILVNEAPSPQTARPHRVRKGDEVIEVPCDPDAPLLGHVFKVSTDPYLGKLSSIRLLQGKLDSKTAFQCGDDPRTIKAGHLLKLEGREHLEIDSVAYAGDIVTVAKLDELRLDRMIHSPGFAADMHAAALPYPSPMMSLAIAAKNKNDEIKLSGALDRLCEEDPTLSMNQDPQTGETQIAGLGELHLKVALERLESRFHLPLEVRPPKIAYRETVTRTGEGHYRLKKQTGGAGQFAEVYLRVHPLPRGTGFQFASEVFGGVIPTQYIPAVEKGVRDALHAGSLAGFPVQDVRVVVYDGKSHPVDSKDIAFRTAGLHAFRDAFAKAEPVVLEPIATVEIVTPERVVGDVTADLKPRRGRVLAVTPVPGSGTTIIRAQVPLAELTQYSGELRGLTAGEGSFVLEPSHYDFVPVHVQRRLVSGKQAATEEAE